MGATWNRVRWAGGLACLVGLAVTVVPSAARAQVTQSVAAKQEAVKLDRQAYQAWQKGNLKDAIKWWLQAYSKWPKPLLLYNVALAYEQLKKPVEAVSYLREYLRAVTQAGGSANIIAQARSRLKILRQAVCLLTIKGPAAAMAYVDGRPVGQVPVEVVIRPGAHQIRLVKGKLTVGRQMVTLKAGHAETITVLAPVRIAPPPRKRRLAARVANHVVPVPSRPVHRDRRLPKAYALTFAVLAVAVGAAATGTGVKALQLNHEWKDTGSSATRKSGMVLQDVTNALWGVSGATAVTAVVLALFTRWRGTTPSRDGDVAALVEVAPQVGGAFVSVRGRY